VDASEDSACLRRRKPPESLYELSQLNIVIKAGIILYGTLAGASFASAPFTVQEQGVPLTSIAPKQMQAEFSREDSPVAI
jgi:hypothetical protein